NAVPVPPTVNLSNQFAGSGGCTLRNRPWLFLVQSEKNGGDDPRGGPAGHFVCYKGICPTVGTPPDTQADSQFGLMNLKCGRPHIFCVPVDKYVCGDNELDPGEQCDGTADGACPGLCFDPACTCDQVCPASGGNDQ